MILWRICRAPFADLAGTGARMNGGRWNSRGLAMVYAAEAAALSMLEVRVHLDLPPDLIPDDYVLIGIDTGEGTIETLDAAPEDARGFGDAWLRAARTPLLRVPSFIVPASANLLINPAHPDAAAMSVAHRQPFRFDERLWSAG